MDLVSSALARCFPKSVRIIRKNEKARFTSIHHTYIIPRAGHFNRCLDLVRDVPGAIAEAGVRDGDSLATIAALARSLGQNRKLVAMDSFEGFPPDATVAGVPYPAYSTIPREDAIANVKAVLASAGLPREEVDACVFIQGYFSDSLRNYAEGPIAFLHVDVDLGKSYTEVLTSLYPHVATGGVILFDEYDHPADLKKWPDAKPAIDGYLAGKKYRVVETGFRGKRAIQKLN